MDFFHFSGKSCPYRIITLKYLHYNYKLSVAAQQMFQHHQKPQKLKFSVSNGLFSNLNSNQLSLSMLPKLSDQHME